jgi:tetratricopeptide (TPR) repeat protein
MLEHYDEAKDTFNSINTTSMKEEDRLEISTWQKAIEMIQGNASVGFDFIRFKERFLKTYLTPLYYQFAYLDLGDSIARNDLEHADEILRAIKITDKKDKKLLPYINDNIFYNGLYLQKNGDIDAAIKLWQTLADDKSDSRNRSRATFFIARTLYDAKRIKEDEAIDKINKARFAWRGDDTEFDMLNYLGDLYLKKKDYVDTLRIWKLIASSFAAKSDLLEITTRMSKLFFQIFGVGGEANAMNDLKAVALFYEFRELTPIGKMGDEIVQQLSYKLIKMDLLDRASALLNHQINFRLSGIDRVLIADKLALLYILNLKPNKALDTLDNTEDPSITPEIRAERSRIKAQALIALKQNDLALEAIQSDNGDEANMIRVNIAWDKSDWSKVIQLLSPVLDKKASLGNRFSAQDSEYVLRLALCNIMLNNQQGVKDIYNKYEKLMDNKTNLQATLDFIAKGDAPIDYTALEQTLGLTSMVGFMDQYRKTIISPTITSAQ